MSAIQIYRYEDKKYCFDLKAFKDIIEKSDGNSVAIYSMTGPLRMGKSFMLGFFLKYLKNKGKKDWIKDKLKNSFTIGNESVRETTGIWIWSEPFVMKGKDGKKVSVYLMDTQGCFDNKTSMQDNAIVFALSTLLSSVMIFNIEKQLSEDILQFLQYFAGFARLADEENKDEPFQRLMFLIRDWQFPDYDYGYYDDNTSIDGKNYKTNALDIREDMPKDVKFVHESILSSFENVSFYLMPYPGNDIARGKIHQKYTLDKDFAKHLSQFVPLVLNKESIVPKKIGGDYITGAQLIKFAEKWVELFQSDSIPDPKTIFEATADVRNEMAKSAAIENYTRIMKKKMNQMKVLSEEDFNAFHDVLSKDCIDLFRSFKRLGGKEYEDKYMALLMDELNKIRDFYQSLNKSNNNFNEMEKHFKREIKVLENKNQKNDKLLNDLEKSFETERQKYLKTNEENQSLIKELSEENKEERDQFVETMKEKEKQMVALNEEKLKYFRMKEDIERVTKEWKDRYERAERSRFEELKRLNETIIQMRNKKPNAGAGPVPPFAPWWNIIGDVATGVLGYGMSGLSSRKGLSKRRL